MRGWLRLSFVLPLLLAPLHASAQGFTIEQAMSAPFNDLLTSSSAKNRIAWAANKEGRRNIWAAEITVSGAVSPHQLTHYNDDDGLEINEIEWTPDSESVVYVRGGDAGWPQRNVPNPALLPDGVVQTIWIASLSGGEPRKLGEGQLVTIAEDGEKLAYVSKGQIWSVDLKNPSATPVQLFTARGSISSPLWSPDGKLLAFVSGRGDHAFIGVYAPAQRRITYLDPSTDVDGMPVWSPDSKQVAFIRIPTPGDKITFTSQRSGQPWSIHVADAETGTGHQVWTSKPGDGSVYHSIVAKHQLVWSKSGFLCFPWEADGWSHLYSVPASGGEAKLLTPGEFEVEHVSSSSDGSRMIYSSNQYSSAVPLDQERRHIWSVNVAGGAPQPVTKGEGIETSPVLASDDKTVVVLHSDVRLPSRPAVVVAGGFKDVAPEMIPAEYPSAKFVVPQQVILPAADGMPIHAQLYLPPSDGRKHPAVIFFHGGPMRQMLLGFHYSIYYSNAYAMNQYLVSKGYVVLAVNYRSGIGYGMKFREAIDYGAGGASEVNDMLGAGLYLRSRPEVDPASIGSWGGSYGGYMTAHALARASNIFAAGVDLHGVHDWMPELIMRHVVTDPYANPEQTRLAWKSSPMSALDTWRSPVLLIQGDDDRNVQFLQTVRLASELRQRGVYVEERVFPDEIHDFLLHRSWVNAYTLTADFFSRKLPAAKNFTGQ